MDHAVVVGTDGFVRVRREHLSEGVAVLLAHGLTQAEATRLVGLITGHVGGVSFTAILAPGKFTCRGNPLAHTNAAYAGKTLLVTVAGTGIVVGEVRRHLRLGARLYIRFNGSCWAVFGNPR